MWSAALRGRRPFRLVGLVFLVLALSGLAGCLGDDPSPTSEGNDPTATVVDPRPEPTATPSSPSDILRIEGDEMLDRLAHRMDWDGSGTLSDPYVIAGLELHEKTLVFQDLTRMVVLASADLEGPADGPALIVWNVSGLRILDSDIRSTGGPAVVLLETSWCGIEASTLRSGAEAVQATASEAIDLIDNDLYAASTAIRFEDDRGDHWIENNRIHEAETGILLSGGMRQSLLVANDIHASTGIVLRDTTGTLLQGNTLTADDGVRLEAARDTLLVDTSVNTTGTALRMDDSEGTVAEGIHIEGGGTGIQMAGGAFTVLSNLTYEGPGPALEAQGGDTLVVLDPLIVMADRDRDAIRIHGTHTPVLLGGGIEFGRDAIVLKQTEDASVIGMHLFGPNGMAIRAEGTEATVVAENRFDAAVNGTLLAGGADHQVAENRFVAGFGPGIEARGTQDAYIGQNVFSNGHGHAITATDTTGTHIEANQIDLMGAGISIASGHTTQIHGNHLDVDSEGIRVAAQGENASLLVSKNIITSGRSATALVLDDVHGFITHTNVVTTDRGTGLRLNEARAGTIYNNWFDNLINVAASGELQVTWSTAPADGENIAGGPVLAGNWWHDYNPVDADDDGIGDYPYNVLPYEEDVERRTTTIPNYGANDEFPLITDSNGTVLPAVLPERQPHKDRLAALFGLHPRLDALLDAHV